MNENTDRLLARATKEQLTEALLSACQELAFLQKGIVIATDEKHGDVSGGTLNNQVLKHLVFPDTVYDE